METVGHLVLSCLEHGLSKLPLRDGNSPWEGKAPSSGAPFETSSEGWKPGPLGDRVADGRPFETSSEGWKRDLQHGVLRVLRPFETSSEGWKLILGLPPREALQPFRNFL